MNQFCHFNDIRRNYAAVGGSHEGFIGKKRTQQVLFQMFFVDGHIVHDNVATGGKVNDIGHLDELAKLNPIGSCARAAATPQVVGEDGTAGGGEVDTVFADKAAAFGVAGAEGEAGGGFGNQFGDEATI